MTTMLALLMAIGLQAQQKQLSAQPDTARFMNGYRSFVARVDSQRVMEKPLADSLIAVNDSMIKSYRSLKRYLTDNQVEEYNVLKGRYMKRMMRYRGERLGEGLEATGDSIMKASGRVGKSIGGFFKGLFGK